MTRTASELALERQLDARMTELRERDSGRDRAGLESLGSALGRLRPRFQAPDPANPEEIERNLLDRHLWPTSRLEAELQAAQARLEDSTTIERAAERLELGRLRDRLQAQRPVGCWCFGLGGSGRVALPLAPGQTEPQLSWRVWCSCPEAVELREHVRAEQKRLVNARRQAAVDRLFGSLPEAFRGWTLESLAACSPSHQRLAQRIRDDFLEAGKWSLYLHGGVGRGKTGAAVGAIRASVSAGQTGLYQETTWLLQRLRDSYGNADALSEFGASALWASLLEVDVLLLDDIGSERHRPSEAVDWATEKLWLLISRRHSERRRTLFTSNYDLVELADRLGHPRIPSRIGERELGLVLDCGDMPNLRASS